MNISYSWKRVAIHPWVGDRFEKPAALPFRTLFLGESHYCTPEGFSADLTIQCTRAHCEKQEAWSKYWTKIRRIALGPQTAVSAEDFWRSAAFYNYVQVPVGVSARIRPTPDMWRESLPALMEVMSEIRPERVLVLGRSLWFALATHVPFDEASANPSAISFAGHTALTGFVDHPSSFGFSYARWGDTAARVLGTTRAIG